MQNEISVRNSRALTKDVILKALYVVFLLYVFLIGVKLLGGSFKFLGSGFAQGLMNATANPILGLASGMFATVLIQSSSVTTSIIVGMVASGTLPIEGAIPMVMGANLGTSITNSLVSLGYIKQQANFQKAFAAATIHDLFNILSVAILLPLELSFGILSKSAIYMTSILAGSTTSTVKFTSPIKTVIKPVVGAVKSVAIELFGPSNPLAGVLMVILAASIIIFSLSMIVKTMKVVVEINKSDIIDKLLAKNGYIAILAGVILTISVQSSSITTSLLVPMAGAGVLTPAAILPVTIGANIGTTTTALLASLTGNSAGLTIALVHFFFNLFGMLIWYVNPKMRQVPVVLCEKLAAMTVKNRAYGIGYISIVFFIVPMLLTFIF